MQVVGVNTLRAVGSHGEEALGVRLVWVRGVLDHPAGAHVDVELGFGDEFAAADAGVGVVTVPVDVVLVARGPVEFDGFKHG